MNLLFLPATALLMWPTLLPAQDMVFKSNATTSHLIELYTSEGCSSCPPAEAWINRLQNSPELWKDVFPVAFHVDYWDGLGWPDRFARAEFTQRQRDYAARLGQDSVYTPEFLVNGQEWHRGWFNGERLPDSAAARSGTLTLTAHDGGKYSATYLASSSLHQPIYLHIAPLGFKVIVDVKRGENSGRKLEHDFVALGFSTTKLASRDDTTYQAETGAIKMSTDDPAGAVVAWVSDANDAILQVAGGWLPKKLGSTP